jgi:hypothetical protein
MAGVEQISGVVGQAPKKSVAHRGASAYAPEHTLAAYRLGAVGIGVGGALAVALILLLKTTSAVPPQDSSFIVVLPTRSSTLARSVSNESPSSLAIANFTGTKVEGEEIPREDGDTSSEDVVKKSISEMLAEQDEMRRDEMVWELAQSVEPAMREGLQQGARSVADGHLRRQIMISLALSAPLSNVEGYRPFLTSDNPPEVREDALALLAVLAETDEEARRVYLQQR